jgi:hypothetical protein
MTKHLGLFLVVCFFIGCATAPVARQIQNAFPIDKPFDSVWQATIETFAELNLPILNLAKDSGLITTDWIRFAGQKEETGYCACGKAGYPFAVQDRAGRFNVFVKKTSDLSCEIKVNATFEQLSQDAVTSTGATRKRPRVSTGKLEAEMFRLISEKAK